MTSCINLMKYLILIITFTVGILIVCPAKVYAQTQNYYISAAGEDVPVTGTTAPKILAQAPSPVVLMQGKRKTAAIIVDITNNILYKYDKKGNPEIAYKIASGKPSTPTSVGIRLVSHVEFYPYKTAPPNTNRRKKPSIFGPCVIILTMIDTISGVKWDNSEYIHGTDVPSSLGKHSSHGCIRMNNDVILKLAGQVKRGDIVIMTK